MLAIRVALENKLRVTLFLILKASDFIVTSITKWCISGLLASAKVDCSIAIVLKLYWGDRSGFVTSITKGLVLA